MTATIRIYIVDGNTQCENITQVGTPVIENGPVITAASVKSFGKGYSVNNLRLIYFAIVAVVSVTSILESKKHTY